MTVYRKGIQKIVQEHREHDSDNKASGRNAKKEIPEAKKVEQGCYYSYIWSLHQLILYHFDFPYTSCFISHEETSRETLDFLIIILHHVANRILGLLTNKCLVHRSKTSVKHRPQDQLELTRSNSCGARERERFNERTMQKDLYH